MQAKLRSQQHSGVAQAYDGWAVADVAATIAAGGAAGIALYQHWNQPAAAATDEAAPVPAPVPARSRSTSRARPRRPAASGAGGSAAGAGVEDGRPRRRQTQRKTVSRAMLAAWWADFPPAAVSKTKSSGGETTSVTLVIAGTQFSASSGAGHAEMRALTNYIQSGGTVATLLALDSDDKVVQCEEKPCCAKCSAILGLLGFSGSARTKKTKSTMGSTQWALPPVLREALESELNVRGIQEAMDGVAGSL